MKQQLASNLLDDLKYTTRKIILELQRLKKIDPELLMRNPAPGRWSVAQVLEHLNSYGKYYLCHVEWMYSGTKPSKDHNHLYRFG